MPLDVDLAELQQRIVLCYTGEPRNSGTNNWEITKRHIDGDRYIFDCFERIRDTAAAMREALARGDWDEVGRAIAQEWENRKRLAPGVTTPAIDDLIARATAAGATAAKVCGAGGGGCLFCYGPPGGAKCHPRRAERRRGARCSTTRSSGTGCRVDNTSIAQVLAQIADLLEIKGENAFKIRAYRSAADIIATWPDAVARMDDAAAARDSRHRQGPRRRSPRARRDRRLPISPGAAARSSRPRFSICLRLQGVGPKTVALLYSTLNISTLDDLAAAARDGRLRSLKGMGAKKEAQILKAIEERAKDAGRHLLSDTAATAADVVDYLQSQAPGVEFIPVGSLRRGCETCGDIDILAVGGDEQLMDAFIAHPRVERVLGQGDTKSSVQLERRLPGRPAAGSRARAAARRCSTSPARRPTTSPSATAPCSAASS